MLRGYVYTVLYGARALYWSISHIRREASALFARSTNRAMRRPPVVERAASTALTLFFIHILSANEMSPEAKNFMKNFFISLVSLMTIVTMPVCLTSCENDDDPENPSSQTKIDINRVFPSGTPKSIGDDVLSYDDYGRLISYGRYYFTYIENNVLIEYTNSDGIVEFTIAAIIEDDGFVHSAVTYESDGINQYEENNYSFNYDNDGHLIQVKGVFDDEQSVCNITYNSDSDISAVETTSIYGSERSTILYVTDIVSHPIINNSGIMFFDDCFDIDLDDLSVLYYAGILGIGTKHLPIARITDSDGNSSTTYYFDWALQSNGFPIQMTKRYEWGNNIHHIVW